MANQITLEQALFGYRDGHTVLAASAAFTPSVRQFLATVTDSSGSESPKGFEGAFTGLPVSDTDYYALFCTWPAPEMPRPGCVWSHVLLIELGDLARIPDLRTLRQIYSRPQSPQNTVKYESRIMLDTPKHEPQEPTSRDEHQASTILNALYAHPDDGVIIMDKTGTAWEDVVFRIWSQQWPRLRREFAFSTGSLGDRRLAGIPFDLQIAPAGTERLWRRSDKPTLLVEYVQTPRFPSQDEMPLWLTLAKDDLRESQTTNLREFLFDYGSDAERPRAAFSKLCTIYHQLSVTGASDWAKLLALAADFFPNPAETVRLKRTLLSLPEALESSEKLLRALSIVSFFLNSPNSSAYPNLDFDFASSAAGLWKEKREETTALLSRLVQQDETPAATAFARAIARAVDISAFISIGAQHPELVSMVIRHNPTLAFEVDTWKQWGYIQTQVYETLTELGLSESEWGKIVGAMFIAATFVSVRDAAARAGPCAMRGAFRWLEDPIAHETLPSRSWQEALAPYAEQLVTTDLSLRPPELALAAWCLPTDEARNVLSASREDVQRLADEPPETIPMPLRVPIAFVLLTLGLREFSKLGSRLIVRAFYEVHEALATGNHSYDSWRLLSPELPDLGPWRNWDRCERLRQAIRSHPAMEQRGIQLARSARTKEQAKIARKIFESLDGTTEFLD